MEPIPDMLRFGDAPALGAPALIAIAIAIAAFIVWLAVGTRDPDFIDVLKWISAGVIGVIGIAYAGSWHEVAVDAVTRQVTERYGFLGYRLDWMGTQLRFEDFTAVIVEQEISE